MSAISTSTPLTVSKPGGWTRLDRILIGLLLFCTFALYFHTREFDFVQFDDEYYVYQNMHVLQGLSLESVRWSMTAVVTGNWQPVTLLTEMLISTAFGPSAAVFHLTNAFLHAVNAALLFLFLRKSTGRSWPAFFTAAIWALHPLRVESVAWISELKDVLCGTLWLACMLAYLHYSRRRTIGGYALVLALNAMALAAKPMSVTLPAALLLMDYWPLLQSENPSGLSKWWSTRFAEKLPLVGLSIADIACALHTQHTTPASHAIFTLATRCKNAPIAAVDYLRDSFFPWHLGVFYPHPAMMNQAIPIVSTIGACALLLAITLIVLLGRKSHPAVTVGWFWFIGTLLPVLGLVQIGAQSHADRYTYLPSIGLTMAVVWFISDLASKSKRTAQMAAGVAGIGAIIVLASAAAFTMDRWKNTNTLFDSLRQMQPNNYLALSYYCGELTAEGKMDQAIETGKVATQISPFSAEAHAAYASALWKAGKLPEALAEFLAALGRDSSVGEYWDGLGAARDSQANQCALKHDPAEADFRLRAIGDFRTAVKVNPDLMVAREHLAYQLALVGQLDEAIKVWEETVQLMPTYAQAQGDLADALRLKGDLAGAVQHYQAALADGSKNPGWETNLAWLVATSPQASPADVQPMIAIAKDACDQTNNQQVAALDAYAACLARVGRIDNAVSTAQQAVAQANAAHDPKLAQAIQRRLERYEKGLSYVAGDDATEKPTTEPQ